MPHARVGYRLPELGERVQMGKFATAFAGVWGQVVKIDQNEQKRVEIGGREILDGRDWTELYILTELTHNGRRVVIKASPYELDGGLLDDRPVIDTVQSRALRKSQKQRNQRRR